MTSKLDLLANTVVSDALEDGQWFVVGDDGRRKVVVLPFDMELTEQQIAEIQNAWEQVFAGWSQMPKLLVMPHAGTPVVFEDADDSES